jgi:hypothetical protein
MTNEQIKSIKAILSRPQDLRTEFYQQLKRAEDEVRAVGKMCDHRYPDGKSAILTGVGRAFCAICTRVR